MTESGDRTKTIQELVAGEQVTSFFVVRKKELKTKKDKTPYLFLELGDQSGRIQATLWDRAKSVYDAVKVGDVVKVTGTVMVYKDTRQISIGKIRKADASDGVEKTEFVPQCQLDVETMWRRLEEGIESVRDSDLKSLLQKVFGDQGMANRFKEAPGGKLWHHDYLGGLLEHTMAVFDICVTMVDLYPQVNRDLLITGALLHDIGKIEEYGYDQGFIDYTDEGRLWGHISIGAQRVRELIEEMEKDRGFPRELKKHVIHLLLSHQGKLENGSPVLPMTIEAMILFYADEMDSKANALLHIIERDREPGRRWSKYVPVLDRFIYLGDYSETESEDSKEQNPVG